MTYSEALNLIKDTVGKYKGNLYYGTGTTNELNENDNRNYPLVWVLQPVSMPFSIAPNSTIQKSINLTLQFLQPTKFAGTREKADAAFDDLEKIAAHFLGKLIFDFETGDNYNISVYDTVSIISPFTQLYKKQDAVHIGWQVTISITSDYGLDLCCLMFEE